MKKKFMLPPSQNKNKNPKINIGEEFQAKIPSLIQEEQKFGGGQEVVRPSIMKMDGKVAFEKYA